MITTPRENFWERTPVGIQTGKRVTLGGLGEAQDFTNEFHWFSVQSNSFPSNAPDYPEPRENSASEEISYTI